LSLNSDWSGAYHRGVIGELLISGDGCGLDQELVTASGVGSRVLLHSLEQNRDIEALTGLDAACIWSDTVLFGGGSLDLEGNGGRIGVLESQDLGNLGSEGALEGKLEGLNIDRHVG
jgi:hypothetical protein